MSIRSIVKWVILSSILLLPAGCSEDPLAVGAGGTGSSTESGTIAVGTLVFTNGEPAPEVTIRLLDRDYKPQFGLSRETAVPQAVTDSSGTYMFRYITPGTYTITALHDSSGCHRDSILIETGKNTIGIDTLKPFGALVGTVYLEGGHDPRTVIIFGLGTTHITAPFNELGEFRLGGISEGTYRIRLISTIDDYDPIDTSLVIRSGSTDTLDTPIKLPYIGVPVVKGLAAVWDTALLQTNCSWSAAKRSNIVGYNIYRQTENDVLPIQLNDSILTDTTYIDLGCPFDENCYYVLKAIDEDGNLSKAFSRRDTIFSKVPTEISVVELPDTPSIMNWSAGNNGVYINLNDTVYRVDNAGTVEHLFPAPVREDGEPTLMQWADSKLYFLHLPIWVSAPEEKFLDDSVLMEIYSETGEFLNAENYASSETEAQSYHMASGGMDFMPRPSGEVFLLTETAICRLNPGKPCEVYTLTGHSQNSKLVQIDSLIGFKETSWGEGLMLFDPNRGSFRSDTTVTIPAGRAIASRNNFLYVLNEGKVLKHKLNLDLVQRMHAGVSRVDHDRTGLEADRDGVIYMHTRGNRHVSILVSKDQ